MCKDGGTWLRSDGGSSVEETLRIGQSMGSADVSESHLSCWQRGTDALLGDTVMHRVMIDVVVKPKFVAFNGRIRDLDPKKA